MPTLKELQSIVPPKACGSLTKSDMLLFRDFITKRVWREGGAFNMTSMTFQDVISTYKPALRPVGYGNISVHVVAKGDKAFEVLIGGLPQQYQNIPCKDHLYAQLQVDRPTVPKLQASLCKPFIWVRRVGPNELPHEVWMLFNPSSTLIELPDGTLAFCCAKDLMQGPLDVVESPDMWVIRRKDVVGNLLF